MVPFIRPYRTRADVSDWSTDPSLYELIESEYRRGYFRGIGEFHIYGDAAARPLVKKRWSSPPNATSIFLPIATRWRSRSSRPPQRGQDHLGAYRLFDAGWRAWRVARSASGTDGRTLLPQRYHRRRAAGSRANGASCSRGIRTASCSVPTPGSTSAGLPTTASSRLSRLAGGAARRSGQAHRARQCRTAVRYQAGVGPGFLAKLATRSACSRMTRALSLANVPVGSPWYITRGFDQNGMRGQPSQPF